MTIFSISPSCLLYCCNITKFDIISISKPYLSVWKSTCKKPAWPLNLLHGPKVSGSFGKLYRRRQTAEPGQDLSPPPIRLARNMVLPQAKCTCWDHRRAKDSWWGDNNRWFCRWSAQAQTEEATTTSTTKIEAADFHSGDSTNPPTKVGETRARALEQRYGNGNMGMGLGSGEISRSRGIWGKSAPGWRRFSTDDVVVEEPKNRGIAKSGNCCGRETGGGTRTMGAPHDDDAYAALWRKQARRTSERGAEARSECRLAPLSWPMAIHWRFHSWARHMATSAMSCLTHWSFLGAVHLCTWKLANRMEGGFIT